MSLLTCTHRLTCPIHVCVTLMSQLHFTRLCNFDATITFHQNIMCSQQIPRDALELFGHHSKVKCLASTSIGEKKACNNV